MPEKNYSFRYKWEEAHQVVPSTVHYKKDYTMVMWLLVFVTGFLILFFLGYKKYSYSESSMSRKIQSLHQVGMEPFLIRAYAEEGMVLTRVRVKFLVEDILTKSKLREEKDQYKEHLIFLLSKAQVKDFEQKKRKQVLAEKIKNHFNAFLSEGKVQQVIIENQRIEEGGFHG